MSDLQELKHILQEVGPENIWRPVYDPKNNLLADGIGKMCDGLPKDLRHLNFNGKSIVDLGCNFGYYTFFTRKAGAKRVLGIDIDGRIIKGCNLLKKLICIDGVSFLALDISKPNGVGRFDLGMMIDFIGKTMITTGILKDFLSALERMSEAEMLLTVRPMYHVKKNLNGDFEGLREKYQGDYIRNNYFYTIDYVRDRFKNDWNMEIISPKNDPEGADKETLYFIRKGRYSTNH